MRADVPVGHLEFGKAQPCRCQQQANQAQRLARLQRYSNMGLLTHLTFDTLDPQGRGPGPENQRLFRAAYDATRAYAKERSGWLVLTGISGCGKTHLAAAVANRCMEQGVPVFFITVPDLLDHLRATFAPSTEVSYDELFEQVKNVPLLVLDDLGTQSTTPWAQEKLYQVLNHRFNLGLSTIIATSLPLEEMEERLRTRLQDPRLARVVVLGRGATELAPDLGALAPEMLKRMTFEAFDVRGNGATGAQRQTLEAALKLARIFAEEPQGWLLLLGGSGCGKTHLAVAVAAERLRLGGVPLFWPVPDLLDHLRYTFSPDSRVTYDKVFEHVKGAPLLILDDLGSESSTPWAHEKLYQIIVHRHNAQLPTIITTRELGDPSERGEKALASRRDPITSRLNDPRLVAVVAISAPDYRSQQRATAAGRSSQQRSPRHTRR